MAGLFDAEPEERRRRLAETLEQSAGKNAGSQRMLLAAAVVALEDAWVGAVAAAVATKLREVT